jgi:hypothetical protein
MPTTKPHYHTTKPKLHRQNADSKTPTFLKQSEMSVGGYWLSITNDNRLNCKEVLVEFVI